MAMISCSECGKQYSDKAVACPNCGCPTDAGTNVRSQCNAAALNKHTAIARKRYKWLRNTLGCILIVLGLVKLLSGLLNFGDKPADKPVVKESDEYKISATNKQDPPPEETPKIKKYKNGTYLVGDEIESGLYRVELVDAYISMAYIERARDFTMSLDSIIANIVLSGDGYVTIKDTDAAVKIQGAEIWAIDIDTLEVDTKSEVSDGMYLVGYDILPGTYKVDVKDSATGIAYVERLSDASLDLNCIIANELITGQGYVRVRDTDFAIRVQGATLTLQES